MGREDAYSITHNADGSVPLLHRSDLAAAHASAEMLARYEDVAARQGAGEQTLDHLLNHHPQAQRVPLGLPSRDLLTGAVHDGSIALEPNGVAILESSLDARQGARA